MRPDPRRLIRLAAAALGGVAVVWVLVDGLPQPGTALAFGVVIAVGELIRITLPGDRDTSPVALAGGLGYALLLMWGREPATHDSLHVVAVVGLAGLAGTAAHASVGREAHLTDLARRLLAIAAAAAAFRPFSHLLPSVETGSSTAVVLSCVGAAVVASAVDISLAALVRAHRHPTPLLAALRNEASAVAGLGLAMGATGVLIALAAPLMAVWALPVFCVPLLVTQFSLRRYAGIRRTYRQTIRSLSKVTEVGGYVRSGHAGRVTALAVATGREFGMSEGDLLDLEYAALMHDIGQLSLSDPIPGGATLAVPPADRRVIAGLGGDIVRSTGALDRVAQIVARQADPYRRNRTPADSTLPLASRIIKACSAYDDLVAAGDGTGADRADAMERLRLGMAYEYDPLVVEALSRVTARGR